MNSKIDQMDAIILGVALVALGSCGPTPTESDTVVVVVEAAEEAPPATTPPPVTPPPPPPADPPPAPPPAPVYTATAAGAASGLTNAVQYRDESYCTKDGDPDPCARLKIDVVSTTPGGAHLGGYVGPLIEIWQLDHVAAGPVSVTTEVTKGDAVARAVYNVTVTDP